LSLRAAICTFSFVMSPATTDLYTLSLHDALPIWVAAGPDVARARAPRRRLPRSRRAALARRRRGGARRADRRARASPTSSAVCSDLKSTRLNFSHDQIPYAVFCLKKKKALNFILN